MDHESPWLADEHQRVWRRWLTMNAQLSAALHRQLQSDSGLSMQDFAVLVHLSDAAEGRVRISTLAEALQWERSRLSHHIKRMEARGLIERQECPDDGRGAFVGLTATGRAAIVRAAPSHARTVRDLVFADLSKQELAVLETFTDGVLNRLGPATSPCDEPACDS
ncbi:MAG TPA: MarR family winged helix-turn-helix transcriptional regulator [Dermatophilaceae bacterium]|nr:MarR family winged helix-turn-helix transcriptional regulator [Dermatophilaceae bacterium]